MAGGEVVVETFDSHVLRGNPLRDPTKRDVAIYLPPGYDSTKRYPAAYGIVGYTGTGKMLLGVDPLGEDLKSRLDRLIRTGKMGPMIVPFVDSKYHVSRRGIWGKSSGGYGSIVQGMLHPDTWSALADHSGDSLFEFCYIMDFPKALAAFRRHGGPAKWLRWYWREPNRRREEMYPVLNTIGMAAHYSPNPRSKEMGIDFPFDLETGEWRPEVWRRWLAWDPVNMIDRYGSSLRRLRLVYVDCGTQDQFNLIWGARTVHRKLLDRHIRHVYQEFEDTHSDIDYRYDVSLPLLWKALRA